MTATDCDAVSLTTSMLLDRSCVIYGKSGSGKSSIIKHLLYLLKDRVSLTIVFSQSERDNMAYSRHYVPRCLVHDDITEEILEAISQQQTKRRKLYESVNNIDTLMKLCRHTAEPRELALFDELQSEYEKLTKGKQQDEESDRAYLEGRKQLARSIIRRNYGRYDLGNLGQDEVLTLRYLDFNPHTAIVFDDCSAEFQRITKYRGFIDIVTRGRHLFCTLIMAMHAEIVTPLIRTNMTVSIFTDAATARASTTRATNGTDKSTRDEIEKYAARICMGPPFTKLCIINSRPFLVTVPIHPPFSMVSDSVRAFCESISKKEDSGASFDSSFKKLLL